MTTPNTKVSMPTEVRFWRMIYSRFLTPEHTGKHALGDRARKIDQGILITRFELPFNIWWYAHCPRRKA